MTTSERIQYVANNDGATLSELQAALGLKTSGRAAYMKMLAKVQSGEVKPITGRTERELVRRVISARNRADQYSSWGWLSARSGMNEGRLKKLAEAAGYPVYGDRIAAARAAKRKGKK